MGAMTAAEVGVATKPTPHFFEHGLETLPRECLAVLQFDRFRATLRNAYAQVPLHHARFDAMDFKPEDLRSLDDVKRLPFTVKADLRDHYPFGMFARSHHELA